LSEPCSVLLVDDDQGNREVLSRLLGRLGAFVTAFASGEPAVEWLKKSKADLILLDWNLIGISGTQTAARIKAEIHPCPPMVVVSGDDILSDKTNLENLGFSSSLLKPVRMSDLEVLLKTYCFS